MFFVLDQFNQLKSMPRYACGAALSDSGVSELNDVQTKGSLSRSIQKRHLLFIEMLRINTSSPNEVWP